MRCIFIFTPCSMLGSTLLTETESTSPGKQFSSSRIRERVRNPPCLLGRKQDSLLSIDQLRALRGIVISKELRVLGMRRRVTTVTLLSLAVSTRMADSLWFQREHFRPRRGVKSRLQAGVKCDRRISPNLGGSTPSSPLSGHLFSSRPWSPTTPR